MTSGSNEVATMYRQGLKVGYTRAVANSWWSDKKTEKRRGYLCYISTSAETNTFSLAHHLISSTLRTKVICTLQENKCNNHANAKASC